MKSNLRIMPCLDMQNGRVVKGVHFVDIKDAGDPAACAKAYCAAGADELAFALHPPASSCAARLKSTSGLPLSGFSRTRTSEP